jgi:NADH-quinone oxidoreductase subunit J
VSEGACGEETILLESPILSPIVLYLALAVGAAGVALALPRKGAGGQVLGALIAAAGAGLLLGALAFVAGEARPNAFFYVFALIALGASLRVITHPRPVYAALYFILTILSTAGLFLLLAAEFMTFALIIIYAGAIVITYLFVIMLATEAPSEGAAESLKDYDSLSREPVVATAVGFIVLAIFTGWMARGVPALPPPGAGAPENALLHLPGKVQDAFAEVGLTEHAAPLAPAPMDGVASAGTSVYYPAEGQAVLLLADAARFETLLENARAAARGEDVSTDAQRLPDEAAALIVGEVNRNADGTATVVARFPGTLRVTNTEGIGLELVGGHPLALEMAGIILLMALVGAVVLARKRIDLEQAEKWAAATGTLGAPGASR